MKHREFVFVGENPPVINEKENAAFLFQYEKAILCSLVKRQLLTPEQKERCIEELRRTQFKNAGIY
jgi:hypothetical protein